MENMSCFIAQFFGAVGVFVTFLSYLKDDKKKFLIYVILANIFYSIQYFILGNYSSVTSILIGTVRNFVFLKYANSNRDVPLFVLIIFHLLTIIFGLFVYDGLISLIPVFIVCLYAYGVWQKDLKNTYLICIVVSFTWTLYNLLIGAYIAVIGTIFELVSGVIGLVKLNKKKMQ